MLPEELMQHLRALNRLVYYVTDEEDRFLIDLPESVKKYKHRMWVFNYTMGLLPIQDVIGDWTQHKHPENKEQFEVNKVFQKIYTDDPRNEQNFYVILDPERVFKDENVCRRILNIIHSLHNDVKTIKILIFVGPRRAIPEKLSRYMEVVYDKGLSNDQIKGLVETTCSSLSNEEMVVSAPPDAAQIFRGLTSWEIEMAIAHSISVTKKDADPAKRFRIDPEIITAYRRRALKKTDLIQYVDTSKFTFDQVGGASRFKDWVVKTAATWTEKGREYGLVPPKGVLAVGIWGCGKSLSVKAMGSTWKLPVVSLEMGKLRGSLSGASENNVYAAINLIERVAPCIVWIDEAEKSLSGGQSSAQTDNGTTSRMIGILSTWLQETDAPVCLALTANSLGTMPIEFINRMDERFFFDLPSKKDRIDILKIHLSKIKQDWRRFDLDALSDRAENMVGREIEQAIKAALTDSFHAKKPALDYDILKTQLIKKPRIFKTMVDEVASLKEWVGYDKESDDGIRARFAAPPIVGKNASGLSLVEG
jgi:SpoVK/Ycf46/Vps4 family AAA+-type ATPase